MNVKFYQKPGSRNLIGWKLEVDVAFSKARVNISWLSKPHKVNGYTLRRGDVVKIDCFPFTVVYSERKEFAIYGSKFLHFSVDLFLNGIDVPKSRQEVTKVASHVKTAENLPEPSCSKYVRLTSSLVVKTLTVLYSKYNILFTGIFAENNAKATHIFSAKILAYMPYAVIKVLTIR